MTVKRSLLSLLVALWGISSPAEAQPTRPLYLATNYEFRVFDTTVVPDRCADGIDNDGDGYRDTNLAGNPAGNLGPDPECISEPICDDMVDNDGDNMVDTFPAGVPVYRPDGTSFSNAGPDSDCLCLLPATGLGGCTANDIETAYAVTPLAFDGCINTDDDAEVALTADLAGRGGASRYDIGMWLAHEGVDALNGTRCVRSILMPTAPAPANPLNPAGIGPFLELETPDACGDVVNLQGGNNTITDAIYAWTHSVRVRCRDSIAGISNGFVDVGQCGSWDNNAGLNCFSLSDVRPNNSSKCNCSESNTSLPGPNLRQTCVNPVAMTNLPGGNPALLEPGETATLRFEVQNTVANCDPLTSPPQPPIPGTDGQLRCGTASYIAYVLSYASVGLPGTWAFGTDDAFGDVAYYHDMVNQRFLVALRNHIATPAPNRVGVVSPNWDTVAPIDPRFFTITFTLAPNGGGAQTVSVPATVYWSGTAIDTSGDGTVSAAEYSAWIPAALGGSGAARPQNCLDCGCNFSFSTTPVSLASFLATESAPGIVEFEWTTANEVNNVAFELYADTPEGIVKLTASPIAARGDGEFGAHTYRFSAAVPEGTTRYYLDDLATNGRTRRHGPYDSNRQFGGRVASERVDWNRVREQRDREQSHRNRASALSTTLTPEAGAISGGAKLVAEIGVETTGIQRLTYEALASAGVDLAGQKASRLALVGADGAKVPLRVGGGSTFGPGSFVEFVGRAIDTLYTRENVYRLLAGSTPVSVGTDASAPAGVGAATYQHRAEFESNLNYFFSSPIDDPFFDFRLISFGNPAARNVPFSIDSYTPGAGATLEVTVYGASKSAYENDHHVAVLLNNVPVGESTFTGLTDGSFTVQVPNGVLNDGPNTLTVRLPGDAAGPFDVVNFDSFALTYSRTFVASGDSLRFQAAGDRFDVAGFSEGNIVAYRVLGNTVERLSGVSVQSNPSGYVASIPGSASPAEYLVSTASALGAPAAWPARASAGLLQGRVDLLVISHSDFMDGLEPLLAARRHQGYRIKVVDVEDVFHDYSGGIFDAAALRAYIGDAIQQLGVRYVLLVGGDTYDYHDYLGLAPISYVPSLYVTAGDVTFTPSDAALADADGDGQQDAAIGRLPVRTLQELDDVVQKILEYEDKAYANEALFVADALDLGASQPFRSMSEHLALLMDDGWSEQKAYVDDIGVATVRGTISSIVEGGTALLSYVGHSGPTNWGDPSNPQGGNVYDTFDVDALQNEGRPTVVSQFGCWNTYYVSPRVETLGNKFLLAGLKGAAAVMGATTLTSDDSEYELGIRLIGRLTAAGTPIGQAIADAKRQLIADEGPGAVEKRLDVLYGWNLLGDPTMVLKP